MRNRTLCRIPALLVLSLAVTPPGAVACAGAVDHASGAARATSPEAWRASGAAALAAAPPSADATPGPRVSGPASASQDSLEARVDALFAEWDRPDSPGAAVAVIRDGELVYSRGYGMANLEYGIPIEPSTIFHIASVSKHFTTFALHLLEADGKLSLDDDVREHLPELADFGHRITLRHLIHHTSGIRDQWELLAMSGWRLDDVITMDHIRKTLELQRELNFVPGTEHLYSNSGYTLMAFVVERVTGRTLREFAEERIFRPLGMTSTHFHDDHEMIVPGRAYSYAPAAGGGFRNARLNYANAGATSLFTTVEDMAKWERNWIWPQVGTRAILDRMLERGVLNNGDTIAYAHALSVGTYRGLRTVGHGGSDAGFRTHYLRFPDQGFAFVVFSNVSTFNAGRMAQRVAEVYLEREMTPLPARAASRPWPEAASVPERRLAALAGTYVNPRTDAVRRLELRDGVLRVVAGQAGYALIPLDARRFVPDGPPVPAEVVFEGPADGEPTRMLEVSEAGDTAVFLPTVRLTTGELAAYEGIYYSPELETAYTLEVRDGRLVARHRRHEDATLTPTLADRFSGDRWWFRTLHFERDGGGRVTGFKLTGGRVRNLRFVRTAGWPTPEF